MSGRSRRLSVTLLVISALPVLALPSTARAREAPFAGSSSSSARSQAGGLLDDLVRLTQRARVRGRQIMQSSEVQAGRRVVNNTRKATNYYCGEWLEYYRYWFTRTGRDADGVRVWRSVATLAPRSNAGLAYSWCRRLGYWKVYFY